MIKMIKWAFIDIDFSFYVVCFIGNPQTTQYTYNLAKQKAWARQMNADRNFHSLEKPTDCGGSSKQILLL
ncbi:MAG: hypothetical protein C0399_00010 [Syntrophus sp. (in: bacteria)]|nr:hypothetical protein [Syntrophus sp. (in: bacteria)]